MSRLPPARALASLLLVLACGCGPSGRGSSGAPTVVLVTWDTVRADRIGAYGATSGATPRLDALAAGGLLVESARAPAPITLVSHATLLTGLPPRRHGVHDNGAYRLVPSRTLISEALRDAGWRTGAFVGAFVLDAHYGLDQGFEVYGTPHFKRLGLPLQSVERPAWEVVDEATAWLAGVRRDEPAFLWVHFYEPHLAYLPPEPFASAFADPYDGEIAACDEQLGRLLDALDALGRGPRRLVVVTSDHGEALGDHGESTHGVFLYEPTQHVPLVLHGTGVPAGRVTGPASLADVAPTVLDWAGLPRAAMPAADGVSLLATPRVDAERPLALESWLPWHAHGWAPQRGLVWRDHKYLAARQPELYALREDPGERVNLLLARPELGDPYAARLAALDRETEPAPEDASLAASDDDVERLRALGYVAGAEHGGSPADAPDPREHLPRLVARDHALRTLWRGRVRLGFAGLLAVPDAVPGDEGRRAEGRRMVEAAANELTGLRADDPRDPELAELLGLALVTLERWEPAAQCFRDQLVAQPGSAVARFNLAVCLERTGHDDDARREMLLALRLEPRATMATRWMAEQEARRDAWGRAAWWYERLREAVGGAFEDEELRPLEAARQEALRRAREAGQEIAPPPDLPPLPEPAAPR